MKIAHLRAAAVVIAFAAPGIAGTSTMASPVSSAPVSATLTIHAGDPQSVINRNVYGHFAEHLGRGVYEGIWVGPDSPIPNTRGIRNDVTEALRRLKVPVLRWPGGCFADEYHWKDGIGPREKRPAMINTHWGGVVENNHFGTHEFMDLCELIGAEPYICGNVGSGTVQEMMEWVEYLTSDADSPMANLRRANDRDKPWKVKYFGVGNESWGCGGSMRPEYYADLYRRYQTFAKNYPGNRLYRIACGSNGEGYNWTEVLMKNAGRFMDGLSLHYYTLPTGVWSKKGPALGFAEDEWFATLKRTLRMETLIAKHAEIMDRHDPKKRVGMIIDEWGTWYDPTAGTNPGFLEQQNSLRDALVTALNFHIFHRHADRVQMTNIAQTINVLQAVVLTDKERMILTPTYHVFELFQVHQGATALRVELQAPEYKFGNESIPSISASATRTEAGAIHLSLVNTQPTTPVTLTTKLSSGRLRPEIEGRVITAEAMDAHNTFEGATTVEPRRFEGFQLNGDKLTISLPPKSVVLLQL
jgi:alpha-L-arabinofuranosidase